MNPIHLDRKMLTPGPWFAQPVPDLDEHASGYCIAPGSRLRVVRAPLPCGYCITRGTAMERLDFHGGFALADARLIAAAPALLALVLAALKRGNYTAELLGDDWFSNAGAAVMAATGG